MSSALPDESQRNGFDHRNLPSLLVLELLFFIQMEVDGVNPVLTCLGSSGGEGRENNTPQ